MRRLARTLFPAALAALGACSTRGLEGGGFVREESLTARLDRGDWLVHQGTELWKVMEARPDRPPRHVGYLVGRDYRQARGGPPFRIWEVTGMDRRDLVGRIEPLGKAARYVPRRNGGFDEVPVVPGATLADTVQSVLDTQRTITLEPTSERRLAFEALDLDGDGRLQPSEIQRFGGRLADADADRDGIVDWAEFEALDAL